ncbi:Polycystic kidney disease protein 1-like 2 [Merluccius polli]|uniref:Polycystic kidney disease protein 1-like 2 n=1 Tax=Merluccius polli TaxID=89951 RepID=A0AA47NDN6_MERPO|nr:Polycystic kidney disease protein 1-like 2 [Merluccius polli]
MGRAVFTSEPDGPSVKLPSYSALKSHIHQYSSEIIAQLGFFNRIPHQTNKTIVDNVCSFSLYYEQKPIKLSNLSEMIQILLPNNATGLRNETVEVKAGETLMTSFNVTDTNVTIVFDVKPSTNVSLLLLLAAGSPPNATNASSSILLNQADGYRWMVTPDMLKETPGVWFFKVVPFNTSDDERLEVHFLSFITKCIYWDTDQEEWSMEGCQVGPQSTPMLTECLCNHLTLFGNSFFVMPNSLDLSQTANLFQTITQNYVVLALLCVFYGLYLATMLWAWYSDRRALIRRKITVLEDNHPCASYNYLLSVHTGHRKSAGTSSNVTVRLIGAESESETQNLVDPDKPVLERGAVDMFLLSTPYPLGELRNLHLQHDSSGGQPSWYINKVMVQDMQTHQVFQFLCDCWLSADRGDGAIKKHFNAAKNNEIASFRNIFQNRTSTGFRDEHIWVSIVNPPWRSPFTRAQRVSCCMGLLLCTMAINIAFWNLPADPNSAIMFSVGSMDITWQEVMVGVQSGLLMFPINILIITIFRSIKPRLSVVEKKKKKKEQEIQPPPVTISLILKETEEVVMSLCQSPKNNMCGLEERLESTYQLPLALDKIHQVLLLMQGETESTPHWVFCSRYLLLCLAHLLQCLEKLDVKNFHSPADSQHLFDITNQLLRKAEMVYTCHKAACPIPVTRKKKKISGGCSLPWWFVFLAWFLLLSISGISTFFTLLYGLQYGKEKSIQWVISLGLSLFQSIFILQPLKVIGVAVFFALLLRPVTVEKTEEVETGIFGKNQTAVSVYHVTYQQIQFPCRLQLTATNPFHRAT